MRIPAMKTWFALGALAVSLPSMAHAAADPWAKSPVDGTVTLSAKAAAVGVGYSWGDGVLVVHGHQHHFSVQGVTVADVGFAEITGHGRVYNLHHIQDFSGTYVAATGEATLGSGIGGQYLRNGNGVVIRVDEVTKGARLTGSADGIKLTIEK